MRKYITTACLVSFFCMTHADTVINVDSDTQLASINAAQFYHYKVDGVNNLYALSNPIDMTSPTITKVIMVIMHLTFMLVVKIVNRVKISA